MDSPCASKADQAHHASDHKGMAELDVGKLYRESQFDHLWRMC